MWIQVRSMDGKKLVRIDGLSKLTKVDVLREKLVEPFDAPVERQRLFYRGKQLEDDHTLFDYNVGLNEIIQIMVRPAAAVEVPAKKVEDEEEKGEAPEVSQDKEETSSESQESGYQEGSDSGDSLYKMGDIIDARDPTMGAWFEAKIMKIIPYTDDSQLTSLSDDKNENTEESKMEVEEGEMNNNNNEKDPVDKLDVNADSNEQTESQMNSNNDNDKSDGKSKDADEDKENDGGDSDKENQPSLSNTSSEGKLKPALIETNSNTEQKPSPDVSGGLDNYVYHLVFDGYEEDEPLKVRSKHIRPRARNKLKLDTLELGDKVMVNYNYDSPEDRGYWYDAVVTSKRSTRTIKELFCTVYIGADLIPMEKCQILFYDEIFAIEKPGSQQNINEDLASSPVKRQNKPECDHCHDNPRRKCKFCACNKCGDKKDPDKQILCDECDMAYHIYCLDPPLTSIPDEDEWYCPTCKNDETEIVRAGEKLKESKKKSKMASATSTSSRDWGKGMACAGRTKECTIVPPDHFGPIPGVEVGTMWKFRVQVSEVGIHRPHVAGIHGRADVGAFSIVLSGGYEDDVDRGEEFTYTGSGGRDLSGNKRTAEQSCDQKLTRMNCALAKNCNAPLDAKKGATATNWKNGKPVRVVRNCKGSKHSKYAPEEGNRYDGIYKIVKYWPAKGKSGFLVWRYLLRRDDPSPAPWTKAGQKRTGELGLVMQYPEGYEEAQKLKEENSTPGKKKRKRQREESDDEDSPVRKKAAVFKLSEEVEKLIKDDSENEKIWEEVMEYRKEGSQKFLGKVEEMFLCVCCQELVYKPVTTSCSHNICKSCLQRSFKAEVYCCPFCRNELGKDYSLAINKNLSKILLDLFPGYENGR